MDFSAQLDALRDLSTRLTRKEDVPAELWAAAGVKVGARLKDINGEIVAVKKKVGVLSKERDDAETRREAEEQGLDVNDLRAKAPAKQPNAGFQDKAAAEKARAQWRERKSKQQAADRGDFDMVVGEVEDAPE